MTITVQVCVVGDHWAAVNAAVAAAERGASVCLISTENELGTPMTAALGVTDIGTDGTVNIGGWLNDRAFRHVQQYVGTQDTLRRATPSVWLTVWRDMLKQAGVRIIVGSVISAIADDGVLTATTITLADGKVISATNYVDASEDGDFIIPCALTDVVEGRESAASHGETLAGAYPRNETFVACDTSDGMGGYVYGISADPGLAVGAADLGVQAYGWRLPITRDPKLFRPWPLPAGYDPNLFELLRRINNPETNANYRPFNILGHVLYGTVDRNSDVAVPSQWSYPLANAADKATFRTLMYNVDASWLWYLANSTAVHADVRNFMNTWGLNRNEFAFSKYGLPSSWPKQFYRRGTVRLANPDYLMTQADAQTTVTKADSCGLDFYNLDCHLTQRIAKPGGFILDSFGSLTVAQGRFAVKAQFPLRSMLCTTDCTNVIVPNCCGATFVAYARLRIDLWKAGRGAAAGLIAAKSALTATPMHLLVTADWQAELVALGQIIA